MIDMKRRNDLEGMPNDAKLVNRADGQHDEMLG